jgi:hypothetical protein
MKRRKNKNMQDMRSAVSMKAKNYPIPSHPQWKGIKAGYPMERRK